MNLGPRLLRHTALLVLLPAIALVGCQAPATSPVATESLANPNAARGSVQIVLGSAKQATERTVLGMGFADTAIQAARVTVIGANMVKESKTVAWNGTDALNVSLNVPVGNCRLFILEALDADPASATSEPNVIASIRAVSAVAAGPAVTLNLSYNSDAAGRVVEALHEGLSYGFDKAVYGDATETHRSALLTALTTSTTFVGQLGAFVSQVTQYSAPDAQNPNGTYQGVHPVYFNAEHLVGLLLKSGPAVLDSAPPYPLEAFRATGELTLHLDNRTGEAIDANALMVLLQTPFSRFTDGGLFHLDQGVYSRRGEDGGVVTFKDVPPGAWGVRALYAGTPVGASRVKVRHGLNEARMAVVTPTIGSISGKVLDEEGAFVSGATVRVKSLNPSFPFDSTTSVIDGSYSISAPGGILLEVTAAKENWTSRSRVTSIGSDAESITLSFGEDSDDPDAKAYFISDFPEIVKAEASPETLSGERLEYQVTLSEPLDETNRRRFEDAFVLTSDMAGPDGFPIELVEGRTFLGDPDTALSMSWNADGTVMTASFNAPLLSFEDDTFTYRMRLRRGATDSVIEDNAGNELGFMAPSPGSFYTDVFKTSSLTLSPMDSTDQARWAATHSDSNSFEVAIDETAPTLTAVSVVEVADFTRIRLTFSEPMAVAGDVFGYNFLSGSSLNTASPSADYLSAFTFAVAETASELDSVVMDGEAALTLPTDAIIGDTSAERLVEFKFSLGADAIEASVNANDPKILRLDIMNTDLFPDSINAIKARVEGISDPVGNAITESSADANVRVGTI